MVSESNIKEQCLTAIKDFTQVNWLLNQGFLTDRKNIDIFSSLVCQPDSL